MSSFTNFLRREAWLRQLTLLTILPKLLTLSQFLREKIVKKLLRLERIPLPTNECRNVLVGKATVVFNQLFAEMENKREVLGFVRRQLKSTRSATKKKAEKFLKKHDK